jgi:CubicO group peptidase (beta-lactamase class C family)
MRMPRNTFRSIQQAIVCVLGVLFLAINLHAQRNSQERQGFSPALRRAVQDVAAKYKIPGIAVALIEQGRLRDIEVFGVRDKKSNAPVTENTVFEAGSLSEPIFTYAVLELAAEGRLDLGVPLTQYLPLPYRRNSNPFLVGSIAPIDQVSDVRFRQITAIRTLNHTSGLPNWALDDHLRLLFTPGERWSYSAEGEVYLQHIVEQIAGQPFESLLDRTVLGPFGMGQSSFVWRPQYEASIATGHDLAGNPVASHRYVQPVGAETLYTTVADYARFVSGVLASSIRQRQHESVVSLMLNPTVSVDESLSLSWGLGWGLENPNKDLYFFHWDASPGFYSFVMASRKTGGGIVIFTNSENGLDAARDIVKSVLGGDHPVFKSTLLHPH